MKALTMRYGFLCLDRNYLCGLLSGFIALFISFIVCNHAGEYATRVAGYPVHDFILDNIPMRDVSLLHVHAALTFWTIFTLYAFIRPGILPFITKTAALFILVRSLFICLTHLGAPANNLVIPDNFSTFFLFTGDLFFSGHVGGPFLLMLIFWENSKQRYLYLSATLFFAYIVLLGHIHYSIDVFAAPFITYCIYQFSRLAFVKDYQFLEQELNLDHERRKAEPA